MSEEGDALVIGGGLAGAATALLLARAGRRVVLLEKTREPHEKVCGEFLSHEALHYLAGLGVDVSALGAVRLRRLRFVGPRALSETSLPFAARSLSRRPLDERLLECATQAGVQVLRGHHAESLRREGSGWRVEVRGRESLAARAVFLASGKHDLHGFARPRGAHAGLVGYKMHFRLTPEQQAALGDAVELTTFPGGYAGLQPIENGRANLGFLITSTRLRELGGSWARVLGHLIASSPHLGHRLQEAEPCLAAPLTVASIPYGFLQQRSPDGLWRVGDQAAVIPSFSGDGMAIALHSGALAAQQFLGGESADHFQRSLASDLGRRLRFATFLSRLLVERPALVQIVRFSPALLPRIASMTRIRHTALLPLAAGAHG